eukprot:1464598-Pyramimonas_sp.AAC.1
MRAELLLLAAYLRGRGPARTILRRLQHGGRSSSAATSSSSSPNHRAVRLAGVARGAGSAGC